MVCRDVILLGALSNENVDAPTSGAATGSLTFPFQRVLTAPGQGRPQNERFAIRGEQQNDAYKENTTSVCE